MTVRVRYEGFEYEIRNGSVFGAEGAQRNEPTPEDAAFNDPVVDEDYADEIISCGEAI